MTTKRTPLSRPRKPVVTEEMLALFKRGCELQVAGHDNVDDESAEHVEFVKIDRELDWRVLHLPAHCASVFDPALDHPPPRYLKSGHAMLRDWYLSLHWRRALMEELEHMRRAKSAEEVPFARASSASGITRPSALAVLRLMFKVTSVACSMGSSACRAPLRMRST